MSRYNSQVEWEKAFWDNHEVSAMGCWVWKNKTPKSGYGNKYLPAMKKYQYVHRISYYLTHNYTMPEKGLLVRHKCDNPPCYNPDHLETGTHKDNTQDSIDRGRFMKNYVPKERVTLCSRGHLYDFENTYEHINKHGKLVRTCRKCNKYYKDKERGKI